MKEITVKRRSIEIADYIKRSAKAEDIEVLIREPATIRDEESGEVIAIYDRLPAGAMELGKRLNTIGYQTTERTSGLKTTSRIFGAMPRITLRSDFCRMASLNNEDPQANALLEKWGKVAESMYRKHAPERYERHKQMTAKVLGEYQLKDTVFTSGIVNKNNPLKYHFDRGNFDRVFSCMIGFKDGVLGGHLAMPEYGIGLEICDRSVSLFDGQDILHGVTPIERLRPDATRFTVVYYSLKGLWKCEPLSLELARIRKLKTERERKRLFSQR